MPNLKQNIPQTIGANDNSPAWIMETTRKPVTAKNTFTQKRNVDAKPADLAWGFPLIGTLLLAAMMISRVSLDIVTLTAVIIGAIGLFWAVWCKKVSAWQSRELSLLTSCAAFVVALYTAALLAGLALNTVDIALSVAAVGLTIGVFYKSVPSLLASIFSVAIWLFAVIPGTNFIFGFGETISGGWIMALPFLLLGQMSLAKHLRSTPCLLLTIGLSYSWGLWLGLSSNMPLTAIAGLGFAVGLAQHRLGKSMADSKKFAANIHSWSGAIIGLISALFLQSVWLDLNMNLAVPGWIPTSIWWVIFSVSAIVLFISSLLRFKHSRITLAGIFILSASAAILPIASIRPDLVRDTLLSVLGLIPAPGFGLVIGASIMAAGLAWVVNGIRKSRISNIIIGTALIGFQAVILMAPGRINLDTIILFISSLITALCIGGLIAGAALDHSHPSTKKL